MRGERLPRLSNSIYGKRVPHTTIKNLRNAGELTPYYYARGGT